MRVVPMLLAVLLFAQSPAAHAAETPSAKLQLELNSLQPAAQACRVTFLASNGLAASIDKAVFELAVFGSDGGIERVVSLAFSNLTTGKSKVVQFDLKDIARDGAGLTPAACLAQLQPGTRTGIRFGI